MANVLCPICKRMNPPEAETCASCGARLKPLKPGTAGLILPGQQPEPQEESEPDWLRDLRGGGVEDAGGAEAEPQDLPADDAPDWLARIRARTQEQQPQEDLALWAPAGDSRSEPFEAENLDLDWLQAAAGGAASVPTETGDVESSTVPAPFIDWTDVSEPVTLEPPAQPDSSPADSPFSFSDLLEPAEEVSPAWTGALEQEHVEPFEADFLAGASDGEALSPVDETSLSLPDADLDWLSAVEPQPAAEAPSNTGENLAQVELPQWVKEMRPLEALIPGAIGEDSSQPPEQSGPLAGMRGVLAAESGLGQIRKPPAYSARLRVSEKQRDQVAILEDILAHEAQPLEAVERQAGTSWRIPRALLALFLLVVLLLPRVFAMNPVGMPVLYPAELLDLHEGIARAGQASSTTLLVIDYDPALAGEMTLAAGPVIQHLMETDAQIVVISTTPGGPALAQALLEANESSAAALGVPYQLANRVISLGYLPGGPVGLRAFADFPSQAAPASISGDPNVWQQGFLASIHAMQDFSQVVFLTGDAETARAWIEQVQPSASALPLYMVTSAQAAPMLMPYVETSQIRGLASGALGGAMYQQYHARVANQPVPVQRDFAAYQFAMLVGILLILAAGMVSVLRGFAQSARKERR